MLLAVPVGRAVPAPLPETRLVLFVGPECDAACRAMAARLLDGQMGTGLAGFWPLRIVDASKLGTAGNPLRHRLRLYPTLVGMRDGREVMRLEGADSARLEAFLVRLGQEAARRP